MPIIKRRIVKDGAIVRVSVGWSLASIHKLRLAKRPVPVRIEAKALIDTGAEITCFDRKLIEQLDIPIKGYFLVNAPALHAQSFAEQYDVSLTIIRRSSNPGRHLIISDLAVMELSLGMVGYQVLIGRDILEQCSFLYDGIDRSFALKY